MKAKLDKMAKEEAAKKEQKKAEEEMKKTAQENPEEVVELKNLDQHSQWLMETETDVEDPEEMGFMAKQQYKFD